MEAGSSRGEHEELDVMENAGATWSTRRTSWTAASSPAAAGPTCRRATGSDASFDKWQFASSTIAASATHGRATLDPVEGAMKVGASPFGAYWYPVRPFGDAVIKLQYTVEDTPTATRNGGAQNLTWLDSLIVGQGGATVWQTARAPQITAGT